MKFKDIKILDDAGKYTSDLSIVFEYVEDELEFSVLKDFFKCVKENGLTFGKDVGKFFVSDWVSPDNRKDVKKAISNILDSSTFAMVYIHNEEQILNFLASFRVKNNELFQSIE
jgi:hypothetical protein